MEKSLKQILFLKRCVEEGGSLEGLKEVFESWTREKLKKEELKKILNGLKEGGFLDCDEDGFWCATVEGGKKLNELLKDKIVAHGIRDAIAVYLSETELKVLKNCSESVPMSVDKIAKDVGSSLQEISEALSSLANKRLVIKNEEGWWRTLNGRECIDGTRDVKVSKIVAIEKQAAHEL